MSDLSFDIRSPSGLLRKFRYDIVRLKKARYTEDVRYAAYDCAISGWHLVDWLLASVDDTHYLALCGKPRGERGVAKAFITKNAHRLPGLEHCQQIANTGKHLVLSSPTDPSLSTRTSVRFDPPLDLSYPAMARRTNMFPMAYVQVGLHRMDAVAFFMDLERAWRAVLVDEGHLGSDLRHVEIDFALPIDSMDDLLP